MSRACRTTAWLLVALPLCGCTQQQPTEPIVVGHLAPRGAGGRARDGILLAVDDLKSDDFRVNGRRVEVHHADARAGDGLVADETVRLVTITRAAALLAGTDAAHAGEVARAALPYGVPLLTPSPLPSPAADNAFSTSVTSEYQGRTLARFAAQELKGKHAVALVDERNAVSGAAAAFVKEFGREGGRRAEAWPFDSDAALTDLASRAAKAKPDALLFDGAAHDLVRLRGLLPSEEPRMPIFFGGEPGAWHDLMAEGGADGVYALSTFDDAAPKAKEFARRYQERFREEPGVHAAAAYEGAAILFEAMRRARSTRLDQVRAALTGPESFESLSGPLTFDKDDRHARRTVFVVTGEGSRAKAVKRYDPPTK